MITLLNKLNRLFAFTKHIPDSFNLLIARLAIATVFWRSVQTKISGADFLGQSWAFYDLNSSTMLLFEYDYRVPLLPSEFAAYTATFAEFFLSIFLVLGIFTRLSALGLLTMTAVIQLFVYPGAWPTHILWAALLIYILRDGAGKLSLDYALMRNH